MGSHFVKTGLGNDVASAQYFDTPQQAFSQANQNLQASGVGRPNFLTQQTNATVTPSDPSNPEAAPDIQGGTLAPNFLSQPTNLPKIQTPSFLQAQNNPQLAQKSETKMGKLFQILSGTIQGGAAGLGQRTVGAGFAAAQDSAIQRQQARQQQDEANLKNQQGQQQLQLGNAEIQMLPLKYQAAGLGLAKTASDITKNESDTKANEAKAAQEAADAISKKYLKLDDGRVLDISGDKPVPVQGVGDLAPLDAETAKRAGIPEQAGQLKSVKAIKQIKDMVDAGQHITTGDGRSKIVDLSGKTVADLGAATPVVVNSIQNGSGFSGGPKPGEPETDPNVLGVAHGSLKIQDVITPRTPLAYRRDFLARVQAVNPEFSSYNYDVNKKVQEGEVPSKIGDQRLGFTTAVSHADLLQKAFDALKNGDNASLNSLKNSWQAAFGSGLPASTQAIIDAYNHEVNTVVAKGHTTDKEIADRGATLSSNSNPDTVRRVLGAYRGLMQSKIQNLDKQITKAKGQPAPSAAAPAATHVFNPATGKAEPVKAAVQ